MRPIRTPADVLEPRIGLLSEEYVLVQAWKKTASYIRRHNWYSDTLELDRAAINLPRFLEELAEQLKAPGQWLNDPLRIVPAPKSQPWLVDPKNGRWKPVDAREVAAHLRPLAHVSLKDQVAATAVMLCLADPVETLQGDPRAPITNAKQRKRVISYGNRLFCDAIGEELRHRWGSRNLYRKYYQDYRSFVSRPQIVAEAISRSSDARILIVHSDLRQFYDRVRPELLAQKLAALARPGDDPDFYALASRLLSWAWHKRDSREVTGYAKQAEISDFSRIALPQGLVAAGFFANVVLLDFDGALRKALSRNIAPGIRIKDICRYVDDLHIVLTVKGDTEPGEVQQHITYWIQKLLDRHAKGLKASEDKTTVAVFGGDERPWVRQSRKMARIQSAISGGFDAIGGEEILDAVQGLIRSQRRYAEDRTKDQGWPLSPIPDVGDETVARFAAVRFRSTYRSLRPLLADHHEDGPVDDEDAAGDATAGRSFVPRTQTEIDHEARVFALGLIENWVQNPSNVRLLRIGLDLWPADDVLKRVLALLRPFTMKGGRRTAPRRVALYCLSEIFRAGATETGFVEDGEPLPSKIDIDAYRSTLRKEAIRLAAPPASTLPWYLRQQVLLFLAANDSTQASVFRIGRSSETRHYRELIRFLRGRRRGMTDADFATLAVLTRRSFRGRETAVRLANKGITGKRLQLIGETDPSFALEILESRPTLSKGLSPRLHADLCRDRQARADDWEPLSQIVLQGEPNGRLRNELALLRFAREFLEAWPEAEDRATEAIAPSDVLVKLKPPTAEGGIWEVDEVKIEPSPAAPVGSMYRPPSWCSPGERWRFHLGYLLRFILAAQPDFTKIVRPPHWKEGRAIYRIPESHWYQRLYGLNNEHSAFGDDWLPISDWTEGLLSALLRWPGCRTWEMTEWVRDGIEKTRESVDRRLRHLSDMQGISNSVLMLPITAPRLVNSSEDRRLRACVVQTVIPAPCDFGLADPTLPGPLIRQRHRRHLSAALAAVDRMLDLRETHRERDHSLDWLILPEISVHPRDVTTHLVPFALAHKTIILAGLTYHTSRGAQGLVNSAIWVIPERSEAHGLQLRMYEQGKYHIAPDQRLLGDAAAVQGFRPCQWLVGYEWSEPGQNRPLWLTAAICYDATDLRLAADLRDQTDVFAIPALNKDVTTFDNMALALHYHMFQMVIVANNGTYGGSSAYAPYKKSFDKQVFHLHGQPQASIAFLEIDDIAGFIRRTTDARLLPQPAEDPEPTPLKWKYPPAGME